MLFRKCTIPLIAAIILQTSYITLADKQGKSFFDHPALEGLIHNLNLNWKTYTVYFDSSGVLGIDISVISAVKYILNSKLKFRFPTFTYHRLALRVKTIVTALHSYMSDFRNSLMVYYRIRPWNQNSLLLFLS